MHVTMIHMLYAYGYIFHDYSIYPPILSNKRPYFLDRYLNEIVPEYIDIDGRLCGDSHVFLVYEQSEWKVETCKYRVQSGCDEYYVL